MNNKGKVFFVLLGFFILDLAIPVKFMLNVEFLFLGVVLVSLYSSFSNVFLAVILLGLIKDSLLFNSFPFSAILFSLTAIAIHYLFKYFKKRVAVFNFFVVVLIIIFYALLCGLVERQFSFSFLLTFIFQSSVAFFFIDLILKKWIQN